MSAQVDQILSKQQQYEIFGQHHKSYLDKKFPGSILDKLLPVTSIHSDLTMKIKLIEMCDRESHTMIISSDFLTQIKEHMQIQNAQVIVCFLKIIQ